jgi:hypothetical protein
MSEKARQAGLYDVSFMGEKRSRETVFAPEGVLAGPTSTKAPKRGDVRHDTFENHAGLQILELFHSLTEACRFVGRARITSRLLEFPQDVSDGRHPEHGISECLRLELA